GTNLRARPVGIDSHWHRIRVVDVEKVRVIAGCTHQCRAGGSQRSRGDRHALLCLLANRAHLNAPTIASASRSSRQGLQFWAFLDTRRPSNSEDEECSIESGFSGMACCSNAPQGAEGSS